MSRSSQVMRRVRPRRGFGLLDVGLSIGVGMLAVAGYLQFQSDTTATLKAAGAADFMEQIATASSDYLRANAGTLQQSIAPGSSAVIPVTGNDTVYGLPSLQSAGLLPSSFTNVNGFGQSAAFIVRNVAATGTTPEHVEGMLTTYGGASMSDHELGLAMGKIGGLGGAMYARPPIGVAGTTIQGAYGTWSSPAANWNPGGGIAPTTGHLMANVSNLSSASAPWLNRYATGNPDDNTMHTNINVNGNNLDRIGNTDTQTLSDSRADNIAVNSKLMVANGGEACTANVTGCGWLVSDDGGFYDNNDSWITYQGARAGSGLKIGGAGNNLDIQGTTTAEDTLFAENGIEIRDGLLQVDGDQGIQWGNHGGAGLEMTDDNWIRTYGGNALQGISTNILQAAELQDRNNPDYYVQPSQTSYLNQLQAANLIVSQDAQIDQNLTVLGNATVSGTMTAGEVSSLDNVVAQNDVDAIHNGNIGNDLTVGNDAVVGQDIFVDRNAVVAGGVFASDGNFTGGGVLTNGVIWFQNAQGQPAGTNGFNGGSCGQGVSKSEPPIETLAIANDNNLMWCGADQTWHELQWVPQGQSPGQSSD